VQALAIYLFYDRHWDNVTHHTSKMIAGEIKIFIDAVNKKDMTSVSQLGQAFNFSSRIVPIATELNIINNYNIQEVIIFDAVLKNTLRFPVEAGYISDSGKILVSVHLSDCNVLISIPHKPLINPTTNIFVWWIFALNALFMLIALLFTKNQIRSILELVNAANQFGRKFEHKCTDHKYKPSGAIEIRTAGYAVIRMKDRIARVAQKRTMMLAMISHDLRTPLTRMLLQIELLPQTKEHLLLRHDITSMKHMIDSYIDFAKGEGGEEFVIVKICEWISEFLNKNVHQHIEYINNSNNNNSDILVQIKPHAFTRALNNVIENAQKYSTQSIIFLNIDAECVIITVEDNGQGIPENEKALVIKPFYRSDKARSTSDGSVGLGLSITREIILGHMGKLELLDSKSLGGLKVSITLPIYKTDV
jgi:two-component system osmolarity sensor histidine kinase EnvZ